MTERQRDAPAATVERARQGTLDSVVGTAEAEWGGCADHRALVQALTAHDLVSEAGIEVRDSTSSLEQKCMPST